MARIYLLIILFSCSKEEIEPTEMSVRFFHSLISQPTVNADWWLAGNIPESTDYTVYDPMAAGSLADSYVNLANPGTRNAAVGVAPTLSSLGWTFNGSTQYLNTSIKVDSTSTIIILTQDNTVNSGYAFGAWDSNSRRIGLRPNASSAPRWEFASTVATDGYNLSGGIMAISQNGVYINGYKYSTPSAWATTIMTASLYIGCHNQVTPVTFFNGKISVFVHYNFTLSDAQILAVSNAIMNRYVLSSLDSYYQTVISTNPIYYLPLNTKSGFSFFKEYVTGSFASTVTGNATTSGNIGEHGDCVILPGLQTNLIRPNKDISSILYNDEFSFACWIRYDAYPSSGAVRHSNQYTNGTSEYAVLELRPGPAYGIYQLEQGTSDHQTSSMPTVPSLGTWAHVVHYNSKSSGRRGVYINGVKYDFSRGSLPGFTGTGFATNYYPELMSTLNGAVQHIAFWNHALTQEEVDILYQ